MELLIVAFVVACCVLTIVLTVCALWRETQESSRELVREATVHPLLREPVPEEETVTPPETVGRISSHMAVPRKYPLLRTRQSKVLK